MKGLFCPLATHGFIYPAIAVARALRTRGHLPAFATSASFAETLQCQGLVRLPRTEHDGPSFQVETWANPISVAMQVKHIEYAVARFAPDVLVGHPLSLGAHIVSERFGMPLAVLGTISPFWSITRNDDVESPEVQAHRRWLRTQLVKALQESRAFFRLQTIDEVAIGAKLVGDLFMLQSVPRLVGDVNDLRHRIEFVGACNWEPPADDDLVAWLDDAAHYAEPIIYVHHGRSFDSPSFWDQAVEALADKPVRVVASIGRMDRRTPLPDLPKNFFVRAHAAQGAVLRRARLVIAAGGSTVVLGAMTHGLPCILLPGGGEQVDVAARVANAGAAVVLSNQGLTASQLGRAIDDVMGHPRITECARRIAHEFERIDGAAKAAELIEHLHEQVQNAA